MPVTREPILLNRITLAIVFGLVSYGGVVLSQMAGNSKFLMQCYAGSLIGLSLLIVLARAIRNPPSFLSCYSMALLAPIWFLYLEGFLKGGDAWLLPADDVIYTLSYAAFFLCVFHFAYCIKPPRGIQAFHERLFLRVVDPAFFPIIGIVLTLTTFFVVLARYDWSWDTVVSVYTAGRAGGSGLIRRGGIGGWEVFLQPLDFMCSSVPTLAALSWVRFPQERSTPLPLRLAVTACAAFLIFVMFLGGSRGNMAPYLAGPAAIWILFGRKSVGTLPHIIISLLLFLLLVGVWEFQKRKRSYLLAGIENTSDFIAQTSFDPTETHRDNNLYIFTLNHMYMPSMFPFRGYGDFFYIVVQPIPRAIWPGKPKGIQENKRTFSKVTGPPAMGPVRLGTASLSQTIVGDGYVIHHYFGIALYAAIYGLLGSFWDYIGQRRYLVTKLYFILNTAWMFWFLWGFRAAFAFITGMYPVWGAYALCAIASIFAIKFRLLSSQSAQQKAVEEPRPQLNDLRS